MPAYSDTSAATGSAPTEVRLPEWTTATPENTPELRGVRSLTVEEAARAAELTRLGLIEVLEVRSGLRVRTTSYVGMIPLGPVTLHIRPKFADLSPAAMAVFLRYALHLNALNRFDDPADAPLADAGFADLIALALLEEVNALLRAGLLREYEVRQDWRSSPRGRLQMTELARHPLRAVTTFAVPCRYAERTTDNPLNRLTRAALDALRLLVTDTGIAFDLHTRAALLDELCPAVPLTASLWEEATATLDRRTHHYRPVVELAALILHGLGITVDTTERRAGLPAFLLDMNRLFERFVARLLAEYAPPRFRVNTQETRDTAYRWHGNPYRWQTPRLRPDLVVYDAATNAPRLILDTKYKPLGPGRRPAPADLYQMTLYALSFGPAQGSLPSVLLYPAPNSAATTTTGDDSLLEFRGQTDCALATIRFVGLPLVEITNALRAEDGDRIARLLGACFPTSW